MATLPKPPVLPFGGFLANLVTTDDNSHNNVVRHSPLLSYVEKKYSYIISQPILAKTKKKLNKYTYINLSQHNIAFIASHRHRSCQKVI